MLITQRHNSANADKRIRDPGVPRIRRFKVGKAVGNSGAEEEPPNLIVRWRSDRPCQSACLSVLPYQQYMYAEAIFREGNWNRKELDFWEISPNTVLSLVNSLWLLKKTCSLRLQFPLWISPLFTRVRYCGQIYIHQSWALALFSKSEPLVFLRAIEWWANLKICKMSCRAIAIHG